MFLHKTSGLTHLKPSAIVLYIHLPNPNPNPNPDLSLYYTLTRKHPPAYEESVSSEMEHILRLMDDDSELEPDNANKLGEHTLYITVFDHKERTTRVYTHDNEIDTFYSTKSDAPFVDVGHFVLEVEIDAEINAKGDPVYNNLDSLRNHHRSILEHIRYRLGSTYVTESYTIRNSWTMKAEDTVSTLRRLREEVWKMVVGKGKEKEQNEESLLICDYFTYPSIEREQQLLDEKRVKWITRRMDMITKETKERLQGEMGVEYRVDKQAVGNKPATKSPKEIDDLLCSEQYLMELLLLYEVKGWEQLFWNKLKAFLDQITSPL